MAQDTRQPTPRWPGEFTELPSGRVFVRAAPAAAAAVPALFIHGLGGSATNWTDLMGLLSRPADTHPALQPLGCTALDLPGFGASPPRHDGDYSISAHADTVIELLDQQRSWPVHLFGNSMGGAIATRIAARRPDLVRSLILISPAMPDLRPRLLPMRLAVVAAPAIGPALMDWAQRLPAETRADRTIRELYSHPGVVHPIRRGEQVDDIRERDQLPYAKVALLMSARSLVSEYTRRGPRSLWRDAARTRVPALILHGSDDRLVNPATAGKAARAFRGGRVLVLPGLGHVAMMERPDLVAAEVRAFLAGMAAGPTHDDEPSRLITPSWPSAAGQADAAIGQADAAIGQADAEIGQADAAVGQADAAIGQADAVAGEQAG